MRIGIDFRFLSLERHNLVRGIPRFTQEQVQSVLAVDQHNTYLLLCDPGADLSGVRREIRAAPNVSVAIAPDPAPVPFSPDDETRTLLARYAAYQRWLETLHLDLYHATLHFWVSRLILPGFDVCPYVVSAYDLMPLRYPAPIPDAYADAYQRGLLFVEQATRIAAISRATADDLVAFLGVPAERIDLTVPATSPHFRPLPRDVTRAILASLDHPARRGSRRRVRIPGDYLLCFSDLNYTKNLFTLLAAYAKLAPATRSRFPLVIVGHQPAASTGVLLQRARALHLEHDLLLTGRVSDHELLALYNAATAMVLPSHHEGFGLTVAEAMRCGTPVITTTGFALREVAGNAALLVDSEDTDGFTAAIETLTHDGALRDVLRRRGFAQAQRFTAAALGEQTLACYRRAVTAAHASRDVTRVALRTPISPQPGEMAGYGDDLVIGLASRPGMQLDVFVDDDVWPALHVMRAARIHHWSDLDRCARARPYDATIHEYGDPLLDTHSAQAMLTHPGIVVLHDAEGRPLEPVIGAATCCVTLTPESGRHLHEAFPDAGVRVIPIGVHDPLASGLDRTIARAYLGIDPGAVLVVVAGAPASVERGTAVMGAVAQLCRTGVRALLAVVAPLPDASIAARLRARAHSAGIEDVARFAGAVPPELLDAHLVAADIVVASTLPSVLRALAAGRCVVVSAGRALDTIPDDVCWRVSASQEEEAVAAAVLRLATDEERRSALGRAARAHYEAGARLDRMVEGYMTLIDEQSGPGRSQPAHEPPRPDASNHAGHAILARPRARPGPLPYSKPCELEDFAHPQLRDVIREVAPHKVAVFGNAFPRGHEHREDWESAMAMRTLSDHGAVRADARVLGIAPDLAEGLLSLTRREGEVVVLHRAPPGALVAPFEFRREGLITLPLEPHNLAFEDESFDAIVVMSGACERGQREGVAGVAYQLGRLLKPGGILSLSAEVLLASDPDAGPPPRGVTLLTAADLRRCIIEASGLEPVDGLSLSVSHWTLSTARDLAASTLARDRRVVARYGDGCRLAAWAGWDMPRIVLQSAGWRYTPVHVALRRGPVYPVSDNSWARTAVHLRPAG